MAATRNLQNWDLALNFFGIPNDSETPDWEDVPFARTPLPHDSIASAVPKMTLGLLSTPFRPASHQLRTANAASSRPT